MLISLLAYLLLGLALAVPLWRLLLWLGVQSGLYTPQWKYLRPYLTAPVTAPERQVPSSGPAAPRQEGPAP